MYTRKQLAQHYGISQSKLRRILKALQILPDKVQVNPKGLSVFYYQDTAVTQINSYIQLLQQKLQKKQKKCSVCKQMVPEGSMVGTRCIDCFVKKSCVPIIYGKEPWNKKVQQNLLGRAINYLKSFISNPK